MYQTLPAETLPELDVPPPGHQRRLTVLLRWLLLIPQFIVLWVLGLAAFFIAIGAWFAALVLGRLPGWGSRYLSGYVAYSTRVAASLYLLTDRYPPFSFAAPDYPVQVDLRPGGPLNRLAVFFRIILVIPAAVVASVVAAGWSALSFFAWLIVLVTGRMPEALFEATAAIVRFSMRLSAYFLMVTPAYPKRLFGDPPGAAAADALAAGTGLPSAGSGQVVASRPRSATRPLQLATAGKVLLAVFIVAGLAAGIGGNFGTSSNQQQSTVSSGQP